MMGPRLSARGVSFPAISDRGQAGKATEAAVEYLKSETMEAMGGKHLSFADVAQRHGLSTSRPVSRHVQDMRKSGRANHVKFEVMRQHDAKVAASFTCAPGAGPGNRTCQGTGYFAGPNAGPSTNTAAVSASVRFAHFRVPPK